MNVADVLLTLNHSLGVRSTCLTGALGERHESEAICPNIVVARDFDTASDALDVLDHVNIHIEPAAIVFRADHQTLKLFAEFIQRTALDEICGALGWFFSLDAEAFLAREVNCIRLIQKPSTLAILHADLIYCFALHLFMIRIRCWSEVGDEPYIDVTSSSGESGFGLVASAMDPHWTFSTRSGREFPATLAL